MCMCTCTHLLVGTALAPPEPSDARIDRPRHAGCHGLDPAPALVPQVEGRDKAVGSLVRGIVRSGLRHRQPAWQRVTLH